MLLIASILCAFYLLLLVVKALLAIARTEDDAAAVIPALSDGTLTVMQPILSGDARLEEMLESNLKSLPHQYFLWLCDEDDEEALRICRRIKVKYPECRIEIHLSEACPAQMNPKVFKLINGSEMVRTPYIAVLDDDTYLPISTAADLVDKAQGSMVATALPSYRNEGKCSGLLLAQFVNNNSALTYLTALSFGRPISINGMCYVMKRDHIRIFQNISHHLTDDLALAGEVKRVGGKIHQSSQAVKLITDITDFSHYLRMMHRWYLFALILLKEQSGGKKALIAFLHGWHPIVLWMMLLLLVLHPTPTMFIVVIVCLLLRSWILVMLQKRIFGRSLHLPLLSILSELLQPLHLVHASLNRNIRWRSRRYRVFSSEHFESNE